MLIATLHGLIVMALSMPDIATDRVHACPFGATGKDQWSLAAIGTADITLTLLKPDPAITWDASGWPTSARH